MMDSVGMLEKKFIYHKNKEVTMKEHGYTPTYLRKKMMMVLPLLVLPFITLAFLL